MSRPLISSIRNFENLYQQIKLSSEKIKFDLKNKKKIDTIWTQECHECTSKKVLIVPVSIFTTALPLKFAFVVDPFLSVRSANYFPLEICVFCYLVDELMKEREEVKAVFVKRITKVTCFEFDVLPFQEFRPLSVNKVENWSVNILIFRHFRSTTFWYLFFFCFVALYFLYQRMKTLYFYKEIPAGIGSSSSASI
jgi:hypothetical protein